MKYSERLSVDEIKQKFPEKVSCSDCPIITKLPELRDLVHPGNVNNNLNWDAFCKLIRSPGPIPDIYISPNYMDDWSLRGIGHELMKIKRPMCVKIDPRYSSIGVARVIDVFKYAVGLKRVTICIDYHCIGSSVIEAIAGTKYTLKVKDFDSTADNAMALMINIHDNYKNPDFSVLLENAVAFQRQPIVVYLNDGTVEDLMRDD